MHSHSGGIIYLNPFHIHPLSSLSQIFSIQFRYLFRTPSDCLCKYSAAGINVLSISHIANSLLVHTWPTLSHHRMEPPAHSLINSYRISCDFSLIRPMSTHKIRNPNQVADVPWLLFPFSNKLLSNSLCSSSSSNDIGIW